MERIKILHILGSLSFGGIESMLLNFHNVINKEIFQMDYVTCSEEISEMEEKFLAEGANIYHITRRRVNIFKHISDLNLLLKEKRNEYDIVHVHMNNEAYIPLLILRLYGYRIRIAHSHTSYLEKRINLISWIKCILTRFFANEYAACSKSAAEFLFGKNNLQKTTIIHNCIRYSDYLYNEEKRERILKKSLKFNNKFTIGYVARFDLGKNHEFLCKLAQCEFMKESLFIFIGDGNERKKIENIIQQYDITNVIVLGQRGDVDELLNVFDVFVMPSEHEGFPMVLLEAQVNGLPCIVSKYVSREVDISHKMEFLDIKEENLKCWEECILEKMQCKNRNRGFKGSKEYDIEHYIPKLEKYYLGLLKKV